MSLASSKTHVWLAVWLGLAGCDSTAEEPKSAPATSKTPAVQQQPSAEASPSKPAEAQHDPSPAIPPPVAAKTPAAQVDASEIDSLCAAAMAFMDMQATRMGSSTKPTDEQRAAYLKRCRDKEHVFLGQVGNEKFRSIAKCITDATTLEQYGACRDLREKMTMRAEVDSELRETVPTGAGVCAVSLPKGPLGPIAPAGPEITLGSQALCLDGRALVAVVKGRIDPGAVQRHLIRVLLLQLEDRPKDKIPKQIEIHTSAGPVASARILADSSTVFSDLVDVMYTLGRAEFNDYWLGVRTAETTTFRQLSPPKFSMGGQAPIKLRVFVMEDGFRVTTGSDDSGSLRPTILAADPTLPLEDLGRWDFAALAAALSAEEKRNPGAALKLSAENRVPVATLISAIDAARGPDCTPAHKARCRFSEIVIEAGAG